MMGSWGLPLFADDSLPWLRVEYILDIQGEHDVYNDYNLIVATIPRGVICFS